MRVRPNRPRLALLLLSLALSASPAYATSVGKAAAASKTACALTAKFRATLNRNGKVFWVFDPIAVGTASTCATLTKSFKVFIPSGSYSKLSRSTVYPLSITEPTPGSEIDLRLESVAFVSGEIRWLIAGDADAFRVRR